MSYRKFVLAAAVLMLSSASLAAPAPQDDLKKLSEGGITVSYPAGMEVQAKKVMQIAQQTIKPSIESNRRCVALLGDVDSMAKSIVDLLGTDEKFDETQNRLKGYKDKSAALAVCFSDIRLIKKTVAAGAGTIDAGILSVEYLQDKDEFKMRLAADLGDQDKVSKSYFPVIVNPDGSIRSENKLGEMALEFLGTGDPVVIAPIHETVGYIIAEQLKLYHPFGRWFNEGVGGWVTRTVITKADAKMGANVGKLMAVNGASKNVRDKINLYAWPQAAFQNRSDAGFDPKQEAAKTQFSIELISNLLGTNGATMLPKIIGEISYSGNPDTDAICKAIDKVTGKDSKAALLAYVPSDIRDGIESGEAKKLIAKAEELAKKSEWQGAVDTLRKALEMTPNDANARLNLACVEREIGDRRDSEFQVFTVAALLKQGNQPFHLFVDTLEGRYVLGRLAMLVGNLQSARAFLEPLIEQKPDHPDAKRLLEEIDKLEKSAKGS